MEAEEQGGFRDGRSTIDHNFPLQQIIEIKPVSYTHLDVYKRQRMMSE